MSQTQWITCYEMRRKENSMLPYDLVLIDTPGFQLENRIETDKLKRRFKALFESGRIPGLHAICFVNQSHSGRLTSTESNLSETLSEIFGHNITNNIFVFATCADSTNPMVTRILKMVGFRYHEYFKFNNTPFTIEHQMSRSIEQRNDWEKGKNEIFKFFDILNGIHFSSFDNFRKDAELCERRRLEYNAKREDIANACYGLINILNKKVRYDFVKIKNPNDKFSTICNKCIRNCCTPCHASWVNKRLCWNIHFFSGICIPCSSSCKVSDHEYGKNIFTQIPKLVSRPSGESDSVDGDVLLTEREAIRRDGLYLLSLLKQAKKLHNDLHRLNNLGTKYSKKDLIDSFLKEKASNQSLDWKLFVAIFEKCKREFDKPKNDRWASFADLRIDAENRMQDTFNCDFPVFKDTF